MAIQQKTFISDEDLRHWAEMSPMSNLENHTIGGNLYGKFFIYLRANPIGNVHMDGLLYILKRDEQHFAQLGDDALIWLSR